MMLRAVLFVVMSATLGCAYSVHEVNVSSFDGRLPIKSLRKIEAKSEQFVILWFAGDTDYVNQAQTELKSKCKGNISGIVTRYSTALGFFSWHNHVHMSGWCEG